MSEAVQQAKEVVEDTLVAALKAGAGIFFGTILRGMLFGAVLNALVIGIVYGLSDSWARGIVLAVPIAIVVGVATLYIGAFRAAGSAIVAANDEANIASHALTGVLALARAADGATGGIGGRAATSATTRVARAASALGKEKSGVRGFVVGRAKRLLYTRVGVIAAVELEQNGVDWDATSDNLQDRIDQMVSDQVMAVLNRNAVIMLIPIAVGALVLAVLVGLIP